MAHPYAHKYTQFLTGGVPLVTGSLSEGAKIVRSGARRGVKYEIYYPALRHRTLGGKSVYYAAVIYTPYGANDAHGAGVEAEIVGYTTTLDQAVARADQYIEKLWQHDQREIRAGRSADFAVSNPRPGFPGLNKYVVYSTSTTPSAGLVVSAHDAADAKRRYIDRFASMRGVSRSEATRMLGPLAVNAMESASPNPIGTGLILAIVAGSAAVVGGITYLVLKKPAVVTPVAPTAAAVNAINGAGTSSSLAMPLPTSILSLANIDPNASATPPTETTALTTTSTPLNPQLLQLHSGGTETLSLPGYGTWTSLAVTYGTTTQSIPVSGSNPVSFTYNGGGASVAAVWTQFGGGVVNSYLTFINA